MVDSIDKPIHDNIRQLRVDKNWSENYLASKINVEMRGTSKVTDTSVKYWESGKFKPSSKMLPAIAKVFGVTIDSLYE